MELWFVVLLLLGLLISLSAPSAVISYAIIFTLGMLGGRIAYERKQKIQFPYLVVIAGLLIGYLAGIYYGSRKIALALFVIGAVLSYKLYDKKILKDFRF